jgi:hypothetical protein
VSEQFEKLCRVNASGDKVLRIQDVKTAIGLSQPWFDELMMRIAGNEVFFSRVVIYVMHNTPLTFLILAFFFFYFNKTITDSFRFVFLFFS